MLNNHEANDSPRVYAVRLSQRAADQIEAEHQRLELTAGDVIADAWEDKLMYALAGLATYPQRCSLAAEDSPFSIGTLRQFLFRRTQGPATYRILFSTYDANDDDPATVLVYAIRHGAQPAMTGLEVKDLLDT